MGTRKTPRIYFRNDPSLEKAQKVNEILNKLRRERGEEEVGVLPDPMKRPRGGSEEE
jgi:hypothetical protein